MHCITSCARNMFAEAFLNLFHFINDLVELPFLAIISFPLKVSLTKSSLVFNVSTLEVVYLDTIY